MFLKLGNLVINSDAIASVDLDCSYYDGGAVQIKLVSSVGIDEMLEPVILVFKHETPEAKALIKWFSSPQNVIDLMPDQEIEAYQDYRERGGDLLFAEWQRKYRHFLELNSREGDWSDRHIQRVSALEQELLY